MRRRRFAAIGIIGLLAVIALAPQAAESRAPGVAGLTGVKAISAGGDFFLALRGDGTVWAWGSNRYGQLGDGTTKDSAAPVEVKGLTGVKAVAAGGAHSLALLSSGRVMSWGANGYGQLGSGAFGSFSDVPVRVLDLSTITAIATGTAHSLALREDGSVYAWGSNRSGQLGANVPNGFADVPVPVSHLSGARAISAGYQHSLAVVSGGNVMAWGSNSNGQLGNGNIEITGSVVPHRVVNLTGVEAVFAGDVYNLALLSNGTAVGWGDDQVGELGNGFNPPFYTSPVRVARLTGATSLAATNAGRVIGPQFGTEVSYALLANHSVDDWGATHTFNEAPQPTGATGVAAVAPGLFLLSNGTVRRFTP